jgi:D-serine deaminase-like pyridoxal phosphate-dependent protein
MSKMALDTPALMVDLDVMQANIERIANACKAAGIAWRPHMKGIKIPAIAHKAIKVGALGVTCAKLGEAEVMAAAGIGDILVANQIVGAPKIARLTGLQRHAHVKVLVDNQENVSELAAAAREANVRLPVAIEVDIGLSRSGVAPGEQAVELAKHIATERALEFVGIVAWEGHATSIEDPQKKTAAVEKSVALLTDTAALLRRSGFATPIVSCGGTGTYLITAKLPGVTEVQAGGGILSDVRYRTKFHVDHPYALTILSTVISRPNDRRIICDAGKKTMSHDAAVPIPIGLKDVASISFSAEHSRINLDASNAAIKVGDKIEFVVGYGDTTVLLHDELIGVRDGRVEIVWPILGRGKLR